GTQAMTIDASGARRTIIEGEFRALQALCQDTGDGPLWERAQSLLRAYRFRDPLHQLVFDALCALPRSAPEETRMALTHRLTLKGFPDVDIEPFFHRHTMSDELAVSIIEHLEFTARLHSLDAPGAP
ncbi:MAG: hypothetical protein ACREF9_20795, partial [Opitutaceae bacterium]